MWQRRRTWILLLALTGVLLAVYFEPTHCVRGWLWGEAFFDGRPTSYWRSVIVQDMAEEPADLEDEFWGWRARKPPSAWQALCQKVGLPARQQRSSEFIMHTGGEAVLAELAQDRSPRIRAFADSIIDYNTNELPRVGQMMPPFGLDILVHMPWMHALEKGREAGADE